jgi:hypothetical protein
VWRNKLRTMLLKKTLIQWVTVISFVANHPLRCFADKSALDGGFSQLYFVG